MAGQGNRAGWGSEELRTGARFAAAYLEREVRNGHGDTEVLRVSPARRLLQSVGRRCCDGASTCTGCEMS